MAAGADGVPGFAAAGDTGVIPVDECHLLHPDLLALYQSLDLQFDGLRRLTLRRGSDGALMLVISMADDDAPELHTDLPASVNMLLADGEPVNLIGETHTRWAVRGRVFRATAGSAFRACVSQIPALLDHVLNALDLRSGETVLDLYAGVGVFSAFVAPRAGLITAVESFPPAATDAETNLADSDNVDIIEGAVEDVLPALDPLYNAAVLDPPNDGLSTQAADALAALNVPRLVYISGDPATLARDAQRLARHGYRLRYVQPVDLAPQTYYIDSVTLLERD
jgi:23S rRNA (uracil1939-C5)-methyltransferase